MYLAASHNGLDLGIDGGPDVGTRKDSQCEPRGSRQQNREILAVVAQRMRRGDERMGGGDGFFELCQHLLPSSFKICVGSRRRCWCSCGGRLRGLGGWSRCGLRCGSWLRRRLRCGLWLGRRFWLSCGLRCGPRRGGGRRRGCLWGGRGLLGGGLLGKGGAGSRLRHRGRDRRRKRGGQGGCRGARGEGLLEGFDAGGQGRKRGVVLGARHADEGHFAGEAGVGGSTQVERQVS